MTLMISEVFLRMVTGPVESGIARKFTYTKAEVTEAELAKTIGPKRDIYAQ